MFSQMELQKLREALLAPPPAVAAPVAGTPPPAAGTLPPPVIDYAAFFVHSVLYFGKNRWIVWLNGRKFLPKQDSPLERIKIVKVSPRTVTFRWTPVVPPNPEGKPDKRYIKIKSDNSVLITLFPNQAVLAASLSVLEGRGLTREIRKLLAENTAAAQLAATPAGNANMRRSPAPNTPANRDQANADKLISQYQKAAAMAPNPKNTSTPAPVPAKPETIPPTTNPTTTKQ